MKQSKTIKKCPGDSVGGILYKGDKILMLWRLSFPRGWAPPAGHVDKHEHGSPEQALRNEFREEVGVEVLDAKLIFNEEVDNPCGRGFNLHEWFVYEILKWEGEPRVMEPDKAKEIRWFTKEEIAKTPAQDLDPAWQIIFKELGFRKS